MLICCVDVGSTFTKAAVVDTDGGRLVATGSHRTTVGTDVLHGLDAAVAATGHTPDGLLVCSSAGGGLRLAVIGYERLVTAQAGHRVGLSAGAKVVHVAAGVLDRDGLTALRAARPDVVLLVGGTDGGDADTITANATRLAKARWRVPVVLAGNADCRDRLHALLADAGVPTVAVANVLPAIGTLDPGPARAAIRQVFLQHVIGGKKLSRGPRFASLVRAATPDAVLTGVELLASNLGQDLLVVDVGGATTDVYSVLIPDAERLAGVRDEVAGTLWAARTVEGDLGMRWSAPGVVAAALGEKLLPHDDTHALQQAADLRAEHPGFVADSALEQAVDWRLAELAVTVALRRHARGEAAVTGGPRRGGRDLRDVALAIGSGGVLRHNPPPVAQRILAAGLTDSAGGWPLPRAPRTFVDSSYILAAAGLLAAEHPAAAGALLAAELR
ncbi:hypothetical protein Cs7R123_41730 [Catellatospora sp. TT07R-123]|uniref:glutamate mutase L n=1 Tax=Catellatospora sp. TT07R-123 TaxID=2733863 RepID=UPI001B159C99|nr:glutamate mutase L [Catellatospora sp. TT07R-123]GHJ46831.1 hypothetical protein Cs7R123_41730 [Catellatospora sp. TT07R-123]